MSIDIGLNLIGTLHLVRSVIILKLNKLTYIGYHSLGSSLAGSGICVSVSCEGYNFSVELYVKGSKLCGAYKHLSSDLLTYVYETCFKFIPTGEILDLFNNRSMATYICDVDLSNGQNIDLEFADHILSLHILSSGGGISVNSVKNKTEKTFSQETSNDDYNQSAFMLVDWRKDLLRFLCDTPKHEILPFSGSDVIYIVFFEQTQDSFTGLLDSFKHFVDKFNLAFHWDVCQNIAIVGLSKSKDKLFPDILTMNDFIGGIYS